MIQGLYKIFNHWHQEGTLYIYSDPHFGDGELETGIRNRPTAEEQVKMINSKCGRADTLVILGDVGDVSYVRQLRARYKILIMGNHDAGRTNYERVKAEMYFPQEVYQRDEAFLETQKKYPDCNYSVSEWYDFDKDEYCWKVIADNKLFDEIFEGPIIIAEKLILSHEPVDIPWAFNIHGHCHTDRKSDKRHFNVCSDVINYTPINFNQFMKSGALAHIDTIHRQTINIADARKQKRGGKKIGN